MHANGWQFINAKNEWHYFAGGRSLCRKLSVITTGKNTSHGEDNNPDNCVVCKERLATMKNAISKALEAKNN